MSDQNANREQQLADGVLDRPEGEGYNPNAPDVVAEQRARFDAENAKIQQDHNQLEGTVLPVMNRVVEEAKAAAELPEHQAVVPHQIEHSKTDPAQSRAGKEQRSPIGPELRDEGLSADLSDGRADLTDPNAPAIPVRNDSMRKDR